MTKFKVGQIVRIVGSDLVGTITRIEWWPELRHYVANIKINEWCEVETKTENLLG